MKAIIKHASVPLKNGSHIRAKFKAYTRHSFAADGTTPVSEDRVEVTAGKSFCEKFHVVKVGRNYEARTDTGRVLSARTPEDAFGRAVTRLWN